MTLKTLGLRRSSPPPAAPIRIREDFDLADYDSPEMRSSYGLDRTSTGPARFRNKPATPVAEVVDVVPAPVPEFIQHVMESDVVIDSVETVAAPAVKPPHVDPHPGFYALESGELIPDVGPYTDRDGCRWLNGVPAFLFEGPRPGAKLR